MRLKIDGGAFGIGLGHYTETILGMFQVLRFLECLHKTLLVVGFRKLSSVEADVLKLPQGRNRIAPVSPAGFKVSRRDRAILARGATLAQPADLWVRGSRRTPPLD